MRVAPGGQERLPIGRIPQRGDARNHARQVGMAFDSGIDDIHRRRAIALPTANAHGLQAPWTNLPVPVRGVVPHRAERNGLVFHDSPDFLVFAKFVRVVITQIGDE